MYSLSGLAKNLAKIKLDHQIVAKQLLSVLFKKYQLTQDQIDSCFPQFLPPVQDFDPIQLLNKYV